MHLPLTWVEGVGHGDEAEKFVESLLQRGTFVSADSDGTERGCSIWT